MSVSNHSPSAPELTWRDDGQPVSSQFDDPYFSVDNGLEESRYVFLHNNGLPERWQQWQGPFTIIETGFGTGLNFLMTWQSWRQQQNTADPNRWLHFTSIEKYPMTREQLIKALKLWPELEDLAEQLAEQYPLPVAGFHHLSWPQERISLTLVFADVHEAMPQLSGPVHAWYLDGFAPAKNPDMWSEALFRNMRRLSQQAPQQYRGEHCASIATFTAAGLVRRGLLGAGFSVSRVPGYGRKREMLAGSFNQRCGPELPPHNLHKPWLLNPPAQQHKQICVIGAGIAGATTARALAERGYQVTVIDRNGIAQGGSGNPQGGLYVKLAASDQAIHTDFYLAAYLFALPYMKHYLGAGDGSSPYWQQCGVLQLAYDDKEAQRQKKFANSRSLPEALVRLVDQQQASEIAGSPQNSGGVFFPAAGWASPAETCQQLLSHPAISIQQQEVAAISRNENAQWSLQCSDGSSLNTPALVIATAHDAAQLLPDAYLPVKQIRGQLSYLDPQQTPELNTVLCGRSYIAPARNGKLCLGATYNLKDDETSLRDSDHQSNIDHLQDFGPQWHALAQDIGLTAVRGGRVGFRCTTPDYLPMVGEVPDTQAFLQAFSPMVRNAKRIPALAAPNLPGLWLNIGLGSRGLASAPLCAELLAARITGDALPLSQDIAEALWPGRFLLRDMVRRKIAQD